MKIKWHPSYCQAIKLTSGVCPFSRRKDHYASKETVIENHQSPIQQVTSHDFTFVKVRHPIFRWHSFARSILTWESSLPSTRFTAGNFLTSWITGHLGHSAACWWRLPKNLAFFPKLVWNTRVPSIEVATQKGHDVSTKEKTCVFFYKLYLKKGEPFDVWCGIIFCWR